MKGVIQTEPIDPSKIVKTDNLETGASVVFQGIVRKTEGPKELAYLFYEADQDLAENEMNKILAEAGKKFNLIDATAVHRIGVVRPGEISLLVAIHSSHRAEGFEACRYVVEEIKQRLPVWKKDHFEDGSESWH